MADQRRESVEGACFEMQPCLDADIWIGRDLHGNGGANRNAHWEQTGGARCAAAAAAAPLPLLLFQFRVQHCSLCAASGTKDLPNLSGPSRVRRAFANKGRKLWLAVQRGFEMIAETNVFHWGSFWTFLSRECWTQSLLQRSCAAAGQSGIDLQDRAPSLASVAFSWKTMLSLNSLTAPWKWGGRWGGEGCCRGEGTWRAEHFTCSS